MVVFPNAKINLGLRIKSKRADGFHNLDTVFYPLPFTDALEIIPQSTPSETPVIFSSSGLVIPGETHSNLCFKAYHLLKNKFPELPSIQMHLHKNIPMGAGLGGGSSDGAFAIRLMNEKFKLGMSDEQMQEMALDLGSDSPFFIKNTPVHATGRGEIMQPTSVDLSNKKIALVLPGIHVSTALAFKDCPISSTIETCDTITKQPVETWKDQLINDFEATVFPLFPELENIKNTLYKIGAIYSSMSGTGSSVYGIFNELPDLEGVFNKGYQIVKV